MYRTAGLAGVSVAEAEATSLRKLDWMATEKRRDEWQRIAELMALIANVNRGEDTPSYNPDSFNLSLDPSERPKPIKGSIHELKSLLPVKEQERLKRLEAGKEQG